ncbi:cyclase-associated protein 1 [Phtheirospermum japonicum]|uniref:Adenylyl cyclase-associated protein n=1 Tax=Phtheirospermum japonicum TaxID=374723 RepID=A0A830C994_9LAMI|nr:cyclase-associated protein 1 [Phtheirospermum japonicum]
MDENLITRLESAVGRLEALSAAGGSRQVDASEYGGDAAAMGPSIVAFDDLISQYVNRVTSVAEIIGGQVLDVSKIIEEAFNVQKKLLVKIKQTQAVSDSLAALAWIAYTGKDCGMSMPIAHVEESWQMAEFYSNKILVEYRNKDANHVEWVKALKDLYIPGLRDYVKIHYPLGPVWSASGKILAPAAPAPPPAALFSSQTAQSSSSRPTQGMAAVFQEISSGKPVTSGLRKVTADMKSKNRADRSGVVSISEKESRAGPPSGSAPTISIDNTAGCQLYLSKDSLEASITTAKSSEVNVLVPASEADGEWGEHALPQQYVHVYKDGQFVTTPVTHSGG